MTRENKDIGFIKIYRSITDWDWWDDLNTFRLFMTILIMANWKDKKWRGKRIRRGQVWTSLETLAQESGLSIRQVRVSLDKLLMTNELTSEVTNSGRLITVVNYDFYQSSEGDVTNEMTNDASAERQTYDKPVTTTKEVKEVKELKNVVSRVPKTSKEFWQFLGPEGIDEIYDAYPQSGGLLIDEVAEDVVRRRARIKNPTRYVIGYARRVKWDDNADHFSAEV